MQHCLILTLQLTTSRTRIQRISNTSEVKVDTPRSCGIPGNNEPYREKKRNDPGEILLNQCPVVQDNHLLALKTESRFGNAIFNDPGEPITAEVCL